MRIRTVCAGVALFVLSTACGPSETEATGAQPEQTVVAETTPQRDDDCSLLAGVGPRLTAVDSWFGPDCLTVRSDAVLYVQNLGKYQHSFTISEEEFGTKPFLVDVNLPGGETKPKAVELEGVLTVGTYEYFCSFHGGMDGVIEVLAPSTG